MSVGSCQAVMRESCNHDKKAKERELQKQANYDNFLTSMQQREGACRLYTAAPSLDKEAGYVASHEHLRKSFPTHQVVFFTIDQEVHATEDDVYGRSEQCWHNKLLSSSDCIMNEPNAYRSLIDRIQLKQLTAPVVLCQS